MDTPSYCSVCDKEFEENEQVFALEDEPVCQSCFDDAISKAEYAYEAWKEDFDQAKYENALEQEATGN